MASGLALYSKTLPLWWQKCLLPSTEGGLISNPPPCFLAHNLSDRGCCKSSPYGIVDCCLGGLTQGINYNDAENLKGGMRARKGERVDISGFKFFGCFLTSAFLNHVQMSSFDHYRSIITVSRCMHKMEINKRKCDRRPLSTSSANVRSASHFTCGAMMHKFLC